MKMRCLVTAVTFCLAGNAQACGPDFPLELIGNRAQILAQLPSGSFASLSLNLLGAPKSDFKPVEGWDDEIAWQTGLNSKEIALIDEIRSDDTADLLKADLIAALPDDLRDYERAALKFRSDPAAATPELAAYAEQYAATTRRGLFARYTLARAASLKQDSAAAIKGYTDIRAAVAGGAADPAGLAVASFGEEARIHLGRDDARALSLYAEQAARNSESGRASLKILARSAFSDGATLSQALSDPLFRKLVLGYAFSRAIDLATPSADPYDPETSDVYLTQVREAPPILMLLDALSTEPGEVEYADQIAAIAYRAGRYSEAARFAASSRAPLAAWVRAKLALRSGDTNEAMREYADAARAFPPDEDWGVRSDPLGLGSEDLKPACRVRGEAALLELDRAEFLAAAKTLYPAANVYWTDLARIAERVLTLAELKSWVDQDIPLASPFSARPAQPTPDDYYFFDASARPDVALRALLGRRLLREGRDNDAIAYFADDTVRGWAQAYVTASAQAKTAQGIDQAEALFTAARLERIHGMELKGYELAPDLGLYGGSYDLGSYSEKTAELSRVKGLPAATLVAWSSREKDNQPNPDVRFHYRLLATRRAERAADALPTWSEAYAATLCHAAAWQINRNPAAADKIYRRYLQTGPWVPWGHQFAQTCPAPDFAKARQDQAARDHIALKRRIKSWLPVIVGSTVALLLSAGFLFWRRRRTSRRDTR